MKKLGIITFSHEVGQFYKKQINYLFAEKFNINNYAFDNNTMNDCISDDLVLVSTWDLYEIVKKYIHKKSKVIIVNITINKKSLEKLKDIRSGENVALVNLSAEMCIETINLLHQLGIKNINFIPYYPGMKSFPTVKIAVTPGETKYIKDKNIEVIDIGHRVLDIRTITDIAVKAELDYMIDNKKIQNYFNELATTSYGIENLIERYNIFEGQSEILLKSLKAAIITVNSNLSIQYLSENCEPIIGINKGETFGTSVKGFPFYNDLKRVIENKEKIKDKIININGNNIIFSAVPIIRHENLYGAFAIFKNFREQEKKQHALRNQLSKKRHTAKYHFDDIIGSSTQISSVKMLAKKIALSQSSVLIRGESGTGKELFAQAIHNNSSRKKGNFVALNCAALPPNLLESELFGYEEGAFTGAKKGGKIGLIELAHGGTIFFDEIGEMDISLQAKLLRVLQEKEVMRIGSDEIISIDIRVVGATNRDLKNMVKEGKFRKDLYYRLNVLPLKIPPLRDRKKDIMEIVDYFKINMGFRFEISQSTKIYMLNKKWDGNIRELRNYVEYFAHLNKDIIEIEDMPLEENEYLEEDDECVGSSYIEKELVYILKKLYESKQNSTRLGRKSISKESFEDGFCFTEQEVRTYINKLSDMELVKVCKGRKGTIITEKGERIYKSLS